MARAVIVSRDSFLSSEFGESLARKWYGNAAIDSLPRYVRGKRKGQLKGLLEWSNCTSGGWVNEGFCGEDYVGHVQLPGVIRESIRIVDPWTKELILPAPSMEQKA